MSGFSVFMHHKTACFLEAEFRPILDGRHAGKLAKTFIEGGLSHSCDGDERIHLKMFVEMVAKVIERSVNA